ncbi:MAG: hypothetical protein KDH88_14770 [Chromatiales bacterium]|nr:hypothetical protein [Chromatiales bacterium]
MLSYWRWVCAWILPEWRRSQAPQADHFHRRRFTRSYRVKRGWVRNLWTGSGLLMLVNPQLPFVLAVGLATIFLSFVLLDETE